MTKDDARHGRGHGKLRWHPAFLQAIQLELFDYRDYLEFRYEYHLTAESLRIDLLIIKKTGDVIIQKNIGRIFRKDNILEYKSPEDYLSIKNFLKVYAYANLYAAITPGIDLSDITLTFVGSRHPRTLLRYLTSIRGYTVQETSPGIYQILGDYIPIQIVESKKLSKDENLWLQSLRDDLKRSGMRAIYEEGKVRAQKINIGAYMDVVIRANPRAFLEVQNMNGRRETFEEVFTEAGIIPEWMERGREEGRVQGRVQGREEGKEQGLEKGKEIIARNLLRMGMSVEEIAQATELSVQKIRSFKKR